MAVIFVMMFGWSPARRSVIGMAGACHRPEAYRFSAWHLGVDPGGVMARRALGKVINLKP
jgi:hypothetical protein